MMEKSLSKKRSVRMRRVTRRGSISALMQLSDKMEKHGLRTFSEDWSEDEAWQEGYGVDGNPRKDKEFKKRGVRRPSSIAESSGYDSSDAEYDSYTTSEDESTRNASIDEMDDEIFDAALRRRKNRKWQRRYRNMRRNFAKDHPGVPDPMLVLENFAHDNHLRFVDVFLQFDRDKSGGIGPDELVWAVEHLGVELNQIQQDELMDRLDIHGDGQFHYQVRSDFFSFLFYRLYLQEFPANAFKNSFMLAFERHNVSGNG